MTRMGAAILSSLILFVQIGVPATAEDDDGVDPDQSIYDCGTLALYTLCRIEGLKPGLRALESELSPSTNGHSMRQLRDAARAHRLDLAGVKLPKSNPRPIGRRSSTFRAAAATDTSSSSDR